MSRILASLLLGAHAVAAAPLSLCLPTANRSLFAGEPENFYMYVDRTFEGEVSKPWEGGTFGFVRTPIRVNGEMVFTHFHEGIDITPLQRDRSGNPLDAVGSIADGTVVHTSPLAGRSNYGKYVVVEHRWEDSSVVSLYAHLADVSCKPGDVVKAGAALGRLGYTGAGINRTRAHLHLEVALLMSARYEDWHKLNGLGTNYHGNFNGMNLAGTDVSRLFLEHQKNPDLLFSQFVAATPVHFKVLVAAPAGKPDLATRYPWLLRGPTEGAVSWELSFSATGLPLAMVASQRPAVAPFITQIRPSTVPQRYLTRGLVMGEGDKASLTQAGLRLVALLMDDFPTAPAAADAGKKTAKGGA